MSYHNAVFVERQQFQRGLRYILKANAILIVVVGVLFIVLKEDFNFNNGVLDIVGPASALVVCGGLVPWVMWVLQLRIRIDDRTFYARAWPFKFGPFEKKISLDSISKVEQRTVDPMGDYGGWGIKGKKYDILYCVGGIHAVTIHYDNEGSQYKFSVTSPDPDALQEAIESRLERLK